jgi:hypothetical protein
MRHILVVVERGVVKTMKTANGSHVRPSWKSELECRLKLRCWYETFERRLRSRGMLLNWKQGQASTPCRRVLM